MGKALIDIVGIVLVGVIVCFFVGVFITIVWISGLDDVLKLCLIVPITLLAFTGYQLFALRVILMIPERTDILYDTAERIDALLKIQYALAIDQTKSPETRSLLKELMANFDDVEVKALEK